MAIIYPFTDPIFWPVQLQWGASPRTLAVPSILNGGIQTQGMPGKKWNLAMTLRFASGHERAEMEGWFDALNGQEVRVIMYNYTRIGLNGRGTPRGTINTTGLQVNANTAQFATSLPIKGCGIGNTLKSGDMVKVGDQLMMAPSLLTANGSGIISFPVTGGLRAAAAVDAAVTVLQPTAQFIVATPDWRSTYIPGPAGVPDSPEFAIDWIEVFP